MGKFGCRLYCWGCGGCCIITGIVMGILASLIPPGIVASVQESMFDLSYIDDTSQTEAEGVFADAGAPISESDAFKAWGKSIGEGMSDCLKADFAFDWGKVPEDCLDGLHPNFGFWNATNLETWGADVLTVQEVGALIVYRNIQAVNPDTSYWDETGKVRFRERNEYANSYKCNQDCVDFCETKAIMTVNIWYGVFGTIGMADGWTLAHAVENPPAGIGQTLKNYLASTAAESTEKSKSGLPVNTKVFKRIGDFKKFLNSDQAATLGTIQLGLNEYDGLRRDLMAMGATFLMNQADAYGVPGKVVPVLLKTNPNGILGWGPSPAWVDPISSAGFTFNFVGGATENLVTHPPTEEQYMEKKISSIYYHDGLGLITQHYETPATKSNNHSCAWDPDCEKECFPTQNCQPATVDGFDGGKIPGLYFFSPKGQDGRPEFKNFVLTYYLMLTMKKTGRGVIAAQYRGGATEEGSWNFEGWLVHSQFKASGFRRRIENCNYEAGVNLGNGVIDSPGIDCNSVKNTAPLMPYFGIATYFTLLFNGVETVGWDPILTNTEDGKKSVGIETQARVLSCEGNRFCKDEFFKSTMGSTQWLSYGYEPHLGALLDLDFIGGLSFKVTPTEMHQHLMAGGFKMVPLFWFWTGLHLPGAINMDLAKLQSVPAALNGFWLFLIGQCMVSLIGGFACCFCGV